MRKVIVIISAVVLLAGGLFAWRIYSQRQKMEELLEVLDEREHAIKDDVAQNIADVERFYREMDIMYKQIDSIGKTGLAAYGAGGAAYKEFLIQQSRNKPYNFCFFPYEVIEWRGVGIWNDSVTQQATWPWTKCYDLKWSTFPLTDSTKLKYGQRSDFYYGINAGAAQLPDVDSTEYLHILVNYDNTDLHLFDEDYLTSTTFTPAVFDGYLVVYNMKTHRVAKALPLYFTSSENISYYSEENSYSSGNAFREAFGNDLQSKFEEAVTTLITDSLGIPKTRIDINKW